MDRKDETMNLEALRELLSDVPDTGEFDLDAIIAEVEGGTPAAPREEARPAPEPVRETPQPRAEAPAVAPEPAQAPRTAPKVRPARRAEPEPAPEQFPDPAAFEDEDEEDYDPRAARIAAREAKATAKREKAAARAAAKEARRAERLAAREAGGEEEEFDDTPPMPEEMEPEEPPVSRRAARGERMSRKEARAARIAAEQAEEEEEIQLRDPAQAARTFKRRAQGLSVRSVIVLLLAVAAVYLSIAPSFDVLPLPVILDVVENPSIGIGVLILLQFIALFVGIDVFGMGFYNLLHGMPDRASLVSFAVLAALLHGASLIVFENPSGVAVPYLSVSILLLYAAMREERNRYAARARAYQAICSAEQPMAVYSHYDREDDACRAVKGPLFDQKAFLTEMERPDTVDRFSMIYVPVALAASIIFALVASVGRG